MLTLYPSEPAVQLPFVQFLYTNAMGGFSFAPYSLLQLPPLPKITNFAFKNVSPKSKDETESYWFHPRFPNKKVDKKIDETHPDSLCNNQKSPQ